MSVSAPVSQDHKRTALQQVLASETLARSDQLRSFLRCVCEMEIAGRGNEINEYLIGVEALGRPAGYSPAEDSSVRSRAYELRQKLHRYYESENPSAEIRIEFSKGSYTPRFVLCEPRIQALPLQPPPTEAAVAGKQAAPKKTLLAAVLASALTATLCIGVFLLWPKSAANGVEPILKDAWGPLAQRDANVLISMGTNLYLIVRPYIPELEPGTPKYEAFPELYDRFRQHRPLKAGTKLEMHPTESIAMGEMLGVVAAANTLRHFGAAYQILPERAAPLASLRGRNVILFGVPFTSEAANEMLSHAAWTVDYDPAFRDIVIRENQSSSSKPFIPGRGENRTYSDVYGLLTVLPSQGSPPDSPRRTVVISGITSVGSHGAMEFFSSADALRDLRSRFKKDGFSGFPSAYQVVVHCRANDTMLLSYEYAGHRVLAR
jgi:hypothetical protein